jgi:hypothetical protein
MKDTLSNFIAALAAHIAHQRGWSLDTATRWVSMHIVDARAEYRAADAPLGDTDAGFVAWLRPRYQPPAA